MLTSRARRTAGAQLDLAEWHGQLGVDDHRVIHATKVATARKRRGPYPSHLANDERELDWQPPRRATTSRTSRWPTRVSDGSNGATGTCPCCRRSGSDSRRNARWTE